MLRWQQVSEFTIHPIQQIIGISAGGLILVAGGLSAQVHIKVSSSGIESEGEGESVMCKCKYEFNFITGLADARKLEWKEPVHFCIRKCVDILFNFNERKTIFW